VSIGGGDDATGKRGYGVGGAGCEKSAGEVLEVGRGEVSRGGTGGAQKDVTRARRVRGGRRGVLEVGGDVI
jgi:hypothetical protein